MKTMSEICIEADEAWDDYPKLRSIASYVYVHGRQYPLIHLRFMIEHIENLTKAMARRDATAFKAMLDEFMANS